MEFFKKVRNFLMIFFLFCCGTAGYDYYRMTVGEIPIFCVKEYNEKTHIESYRGFFYTGERTVKWDRRETLNLSSNIKFVVLTKEIPITLERPLVKNDYVLYVTPSEDGNSILYYETKEGKLYFNGISSIKVKKEKEKESVELKEALQKDKNLLDVLIDKIDFRGIVSDRKVEKYQTKEDSFVMGEFYVYRCHNETNDIYIVQEEALKEDYCLLKNDSTLEEQVQ